MSLPEYTLLAIGSLFVIIDPIATVPAFLAMTHNDAPPQRIRTARVACVVATIILLIFATTGKLIRSEEHTSELQSRRDLVCRLLLEKKKKNKDTTITVNRKEHRNR